MFYTIVTTTGEISSNKREINGGIMRGDNMKERVKSSPTNKGDGDLDNAPREVKIVLDCIARNAKARCVAWAYKRCHVSRVVKG